METFSDVVLDEFEGWLGKAIESVNELRDMQTDPTSIEYHRLLTKQKTLKMVDQKLNELKKEFSNCF